MEKAHHCEMLQMKLTPSLDNSQWDAEGKM